MLNLSSKGLIAFAYDVKEYRVYAGRPGWRREIRCDRKKSRPEQAGTAVGEEIRIDAQDDAHSLADPGFKLISSREQDYPSSAGNRERGKKKRFRRFAKWAQIQRQRSGDIVGVTFPRSTMTMVAIGTICGAVS